MPGESTRRRQGARRSPARLAIQLLTLAALAACQPERQRPDPAALAGTPFQPSAKERAAEFTPADALRAFEAPANEPYRLGLGDELTIQVWGRTELGGKYTVGPDGRIVVPIAGPVLLLDKDPLAASRELTRILARYYKNAIATVRVDRYASNRILVLGRVANPGVLTFDTPPTLLEAISRAGALPVGGVGADKANLSRCAVFRGRDKVAWIDIRPLVRGQDLSLNIRLQRDDLVYLPDADDQLVYVMGEVTRPGAFRLGPEMSFLDALAQAGGPTPDAVGGVIHLVRPRLGDFAQIDLEDILEGNGALNVALEEGDILYLSKSSLAKFGYVVRQISPIVGFAAMGAAIAP